MLLSDKKKKLLLSNRADLAKTNYTSVLNLDFQEQILYARKCVFRVCKPIQYNQESRAIARTYNKTSKSFERK